MPKYCTVEDAVVFYEDFASLVGTGADAIITAASDWVQATLLDSHGPVFAESGTTYPFWIRKAAALESVYLGLKRRMEQGQTSSSGFWNKFHEDAEEILRGVADGKHVIQVHDTAEWERGIAPAVGVDNGTVTAPVYGLCFSNSEVPNQWFLGDYPRTFVVEIDGTGSKISTQTFRWQYKHDEGWVEEGVPLSKSWTPLALGAYIRFVDAAPFVAGMRWEIACHPNQGRASHGPGAKSHQLVMTR